MRLAAALLPAVLAAAAPADAATPVNRPNIVVVMTDDQTLESVRAMPKTRRLIGEAGTTFGRSFASYPVCCPSRATFLSGQYSHNHGVRWNTPPTGGYQALSNQQTLMPTALQKAGYRTIHIGKFLNGYGGARALEVPPGWTDWNGAVDPTTYRMYDFTLNQNGTLVTYADASRPEQYQTDVYARMAVERIRREADQAGPFFLSVATLAPHAESARRDDPGSVRAAPRHEGAFATLAMPRPPSFNEGDVSDKPSHIRARDKFGTGQMATIESRYRDRLESLLAVDDLVEAIVNTLSGTGELDSTLIVFTSDNGYFTGEHRIPEGKVLAHEPSARVPLMIRGPGVARAVSAEPVANVDLAPTILDYGLARPLRAADGLSLRPLLEDPAKRLGRSILLQSGPNNGGYPVYDAIRTPRYSYTEYENGERELYDLQRDPFQLASRHTDPALAGVRNDLAAQLARLRTCAGRACSAAPAIRLSLTYRKARRRGRACARSRLRYRITGTERSRVTAAELARGSRRLATDTAAPFRGSLSLRRLPRGRLSTVRATLALSDGRELTLDRRLRRCR